MSKRKKRANGEGTVYSEGGYWVAEITWSDDNGAHRRRRRRAKQHDAIAALEKLKSEVRDGHVPTGERTRLTVADVMRGYLSEARARVASRTLRDYERIVEKQIVPQLGAIRAHAVRRKHVVAFLATVNGDRSKQYAYTLLKGALAIHVHHADPADHPFPPRSTPKVRKRDYIPLAQDDRGALLSSLADEEHGVLYLLSLATGLRPSELLGLRWNDVGDSYIVVRVKLDEYTRAVSDTKNVGSRRRVDIPKSVVEALAEHREREQHRHAAHAAWKAAPPESKRRDRPNPLPPPIGSLCRPTDLIFVNRFGKPIGASGLRKHWRALRKRLALPEHVRLYDMRHEHGSLLAAAGVHPKVVQERLGHASIRLTMDTYSHLMPGMQREAVEAVAAMLVPPTVPPKDDARDSA